MSAAMEAGDESFVRNISPRLPRSLDCHCAKCGKRVTDWRGTRIIDDEQQKLLLVGHCHGETVEFVVFLDIKAMLFRPEGD